LTILIFRPPKKLRKLPRRRKRQMRRLLRRRSLRRRLPPKPQRKRVTRPKPMLPLPPDHLLRLLLLPIPPAYPPNLLPQHVVRLPSILNP
jgi:hypothetical protein